MFRDEADTSPPVADPLPTPMTVNERSLLPRTARSRASTRSSRSATASRSGSRSNSAPRFDTGFVDLEPAFHDYHDVDMDMLMAGSLEFSLPAFDSVFGNEGDGERKRRRSDEQASRPHEISQPVAGPSSSMAVNPNPSDSSDDVGTPTKRPKLDPDAQGDPKTRVSPPPAQLWHPGDAAHNAADSHPNEPVAAQDSEPRAPAEEPVLNASSMPPMHQSLATSSRLPDAEQQSIPVSSERIDVDAMPDEAASGLMPGHSGPVRQSPAAPTRQSNPEPLSAYTCPICFSPPSYATLAPCGHVCCGECLFTAIKTSMQRTMYAVPLRERSVARCPVCRAPIPGWDGRGGGVIGLKPRAIFSL